MADVAVDPSDAPVGPLEAEVRRDLTSLVSAHPVGEALAELALHLARRIDAGLQPMALPGTSRELRETLLELARLEVTGDDDLDAELSRPHVPAEIRDDEKS